MGRIATLSAFRWRELCKQLVCGLMNGFEMVLVDSRLLRLLLFTSGVLVFGPQIKYIVPRLCPLCPRR